jgi:hypothetical protein
LKRKSSLTISRPRDLGSRSAETNGIPRNIDAETSAARWVEGQGLEPWTISFLGAEGRSTFSSHPRGAGNLMRRWRLISMPLHRTITRSGLHHDPNPWWVSKDRRRRAFDGNDRYKQEGRRGLQTPREVGEGGGTSTLPGRVQYVYGQGDGVSRADLDAGMRRACCTVQVRSSRRIVSLCPSHFPSYAR